MFGFIFALAILLTVDTAHAYTLRAACRLGQPPFNDAHLDAHHKDSLCVGLFADLFYAAMSRLNISFTMDMLDESNIDPYLIVNKTTNTSRYDIIIAFHSITPARMELYDFSVPAGESSDSVALLPQFQKGGRGIASAVVRPSVLYVFSIISLLIAGLSVIIFIFEHTEEDAEMHTVERWRRMLYSIEQAHECVLCGGANNLSSQPLRSISKVCSISDVFLMYILGALITSDLTAATLSVSSTSVTELQALRMKIAIASSILAPSPHRTYREVGHSGRWSKFF